MSFDNLYLYTVVDKIPDNHFSGKLVNTYFYTIEILTKEFTACI